MTKATLCVDPDIRQKMSSTLKKGLREGVTLDRRFWKAPPTSGNSPTKSC